MKKLIIFCIFALFIINMINASVVNSDQSRISHCIRECTEYKKIDYKACTTNYLNNLSNCRIDYKKCLKETKNLKECLKTFNNYKKISSIDKKICEKKVVDDFFNCKDLCLNPQFKCINEGGSIPVILNPPFCCEGLKLILPREENLVGIIGICTSKCGNGICDISESAYNCPEDCNSNNLCYACGSDCTTDPNKICPMTINSLLFVPVNFECKIINETCTKVINKNDLCETDSDCTTFFSNCNCGNYCKNKNYNPYADCARACSIEEIDNSITSCKCKKNICVGA